MKTVFTLTSAESRRLIAKAVVAMPAVKKAWSDAYLLLAGGSLPLDMGELCQAVNAAFSGKGGGRGSLAQGSAAMQPGLEETFLQVRAYLAQRLKAIK